MFMWILFEGKGSEVVYILYTHENIDTFGCPCNISGWPLNISDVFPYFQLVNSGDAEEDSLLAGLSSVSSETRVIPAFHDDSDEDLIL